MALTKCKECKAEISTRADVCPHCGAKVKRNSMGCGSLIALGIFVIVLIAVLGKPTSNHRVSTPGTSSTSTPSYASSTNPPPNPILKEPGDQWLYSHPIDSMTDKEVHRASVLSTNTVNFDFPYSGAQHATLSLRTHPRYGKDLIFQIQKGQILCSSYDGCLVQVRFDDGKIQKFRASEPADHSSDTLFIRNYHGFVGKMLKSKLVRITVDVYQEGNRVFEFDVSDFSVPKYLPDK